VSSCLPACLPEQPLTLTASILMGGEGRGRGEGKQRGGEGA
jgi:hypothetical protein